MRLHSMQKIDSNMRVSIVKWSESEFNVQRQEKNAVGQWDIMQEKDLRSAQEVYGFLQECRDLSGVQEDLEDDFKTLLMAF